LIEVSQEKLSWPGYGGLNRPRGDAGRDAAFPGTLGAKVIGSGAGKRGWFRLTPSGSRRAAWRAG
jgi:hypothetical protein